MRSDGTACATGTTTTLNGGTTTTLAGGTTTTLRRRTTTTVADATTTTGLIGSASGYAVPDLTILGGVPSGVPLAPTPSVRLAADASNSPQTASVESAAPVLGPFRGFSSGAITVSTEGSLAAGGFVTSSTDIQNVNASGVEVFTATRLQSTCTASESGVSGSTTITGGVLQISEGDPDVGGDETNVALPANPAPNARFQGQVETVADSFEYVFNEQVTNPDGSLTVYAAHLDLLGPTAVGDVYIGRVDCGVIPIRTTTTLGDHTTTTVAGDTTTMLAADMFTAVAGGTTATVGGGLTATLAGGTTTTVGGGTTTTTTTTLAGGTTTTTPGGSPFTSTVGTGGALAGASAQGRTVLARTGSTPQPLVVLALLALVLGVMALIGAPVSSAIPVRRPRSSERADLGPKGLPHDPAGSDGAT